MTGDGISGTCSKAKAICVFVFFTRGVLHAVVSHQCSALKVMSNAGRRHALALTQSLDMLSCQIEVAAARL